MTPEQKKPRLRQFVGEFRSLFVVKLKVALYAAYVLILEIYQTLWLAIYTPKP